MITRLRRALRTQSLPLVLGFAVLATIIGARSFMVEAQRDNRMAARQAIEFQQQLSNLLSLAQDAESGQRGYLLTNQKDYLEPYESAVAAIPEQLHRLEDLSGSNDAVAARIASVADNLKQKLDELDRSIQMWDSGDQIGALELVHSGRGKAAMDSMREQISEILRNVGAGLQARYERTDRIENWLRVGSFAALGSTALLGFYVVANARRRLRDVDDAQRDLASKNAALLEEMQNRERAESQVRQMQKMEAVGQLTGGLAHDFNNMLAVIISAMNLVQRKLARGEHDIEKFIAAASDAAGRAANLTARLLAFSRLQPLAPQIVDANKLVTGMSELLTRALGETIRIETVLAGGLWRTSADPSQLENAILNLAVNGRDAMEGDGKLTIETANCHLDDGYASMHAEVTPGQYVMIAVTDTGSGMTADIVAKAFEPFFTTKGVNRGTGLGLSQVFGFVKQSGGHVKIYSEPGEGTTVKIYLPRHFGTEEVVTGTARQDKGRGGGETILMVEDDERVRASTRDALVELGYTVIVAGSGQEALEKLRSHSNVALLFTDIVMPQMNGRKLADEAVKLVPGLRVVFTTGFTRNAVVHNGVLDHEVHFLAKPFTLEQLEFKLREVLDA